MADDVQLTSTLDSVTVYSAGALCRRLARLDLPRRHPGAGPVRVTLVGLPLALDEQSLRASVLSGPPGLRVLDVRRTVEVALPAAGDLSPLRHEFDLAQAGLDAARAALAALSRQTERVAALRAVPAPVRRGDPPRRAPVEALLALADFVGERLAELDRRRAAASDTLREAEQRAEAALRRLTEASAALPTERVHSTTSVVLPPQPAEPEPAVPNPGEPAPAAPTPAEPAPAGPTPGEPAPAALDPAAPAPAERGLTAPAPAGSAPTEAEPGEPAPGAPAGAEPARGALERGGLEPAALVPVELELEYAVPGAAWAPAYQLRLSGIDGGAPGGVLSMRARVAQRTGEDWTGVRLALSTADLRRDTELPVLASLRLGRRQTAQPRSPWREPPPGLGELFAGYDTFLASVPPPAAWPGDASPGGPPIAVAGLALPSVPPALPPIQPLARRYGAVPEADMAPETERVAAPLRAQSPGAPSASLASTRRNKSAAGVEGMRATGAGGGFGGAPSAPGPDTPDPLLRDLGRLTLAAADQPGAGRGQLSLAEARAVAGAMGARPRSRSARALGLPPGCLPVRDSAGSFDYRYDTVAPVDVPADGGWHTVPVREFPVELAVEHVCSAFAASAEPQSEQSVHAALALRNSSGNALLAGAAEVTVDGAYLRSVPLPTLAPGELRRVGLGVVEGIRMARKVRMRESTAGLRGGTTVLEHTVEIELANRLGHPVTCEVRERVPVSDDKDVRIEDRPSSPPWTAVPPEQDEHHQRGLRLWRVTLEPQATTVLTGGYEIRIPVAKAIADGNRRF